MAYQVSKLHFNRLVESALAALPDEFADFLEQTPVEVRDRPSAAQRAAAGVGRNALLLGLYRGRPLTQRSVEDNGAMPDVIYIFQEDVEQACDSEQGLIEQVRITVLHEIGHHFGLSEGDLTDLGYG
jgi:predicted Zn-dependent protease with MMP-like domain